MFLFVEAQSMRIFYCFLTVVTIRYAIAIGPYGHFGLNSIGNHISQILWQLKFYVHLVEFFGQLLTA